MRRLLLLALAFAMIGSSVVSQTVFMGRARLISDYPQPVTVVTDGYSVRMEGWAGEWHFKTGAPLAVAGCVQVAVDGDFDIRVPTANDADLTLEVMIRRDDADPVSLGLHSMMAGEPRWLVYFDKPGNIHAVVTITVRRILDMSNSEVVVRELTTTLLKEDSCAGAILYRE